MERNTSTVISSTTIIWSFGLNRVTCLVLSKRQSSATNDTFATIGIVDNFCLILSSNKNVCVFGRLDFFSPTFMIYTHSVYCLPLWSLLIASYMYRHLSPSAVFFHFFRPLSHLSLNRCFFVCAFIYAKVDYLKWRENKKKKQNKIAIHIFGSKLKSLFTELLALLCTGCSNAGIDAMCWYVIQYLYFYTPYITSCAYITIILRMCVCVWHWWWCVMASNKIETDVHYLFGNFSLPN